MNQHLERIRDTIASLPGMQAAFAAYQEAAFPPRTAQFFALELAGEAGEVANNEKKVWKGSHVPREHLEDEAADVLIALVNYANANGIDLAAAVGRKLGIIEQRRSAAPDEGVIGAAGLPPPPRAGVPPA